MQHLFLIADIAGQRIALASNCINSVVNVTTIIPVPLAPLHILGLAALRSRVITMIDSRTALELVPQPRPNIFMTVVVNLDGHHYGLVVDRVEDVCAIPGAVAPIRAPVGRGWARAAIGVLEHADSSLILLDPVALIGGSQAITA